MLIYYVYAYLRKKDLTPYYIGKGKGRRAWEKAHSVSVPRDKSLIVFLETNLSEIGAMALERRMIRWYGRKDNGTGILHNRTDGGEGAAGRFYSEEEKLAMSLARKGRPSPLKGRKLSVEHRKKLSLVKSQYRHSEEAKDKIRQTKIGRKRGPLTPETKEKLSQSLKGRIPPKKPCPHCGNDFPVNTLNRHSVKCGQG